MPNDERSVTPREIPIFFTTDDAYVPYLDVAVSSLVANASRDYTYRIVILNTGIRQDNIDLIKRNETAGFTVDFVDISGQVKDIQDRLRNVYHFSVVTYYRLFIASMFPQYRKIIYLDCDLVVLGDISKLYHTDLGDNIIAACPEMFVRTTPEFRLYAEKALGVSPDGYVNAGVLVVDLEQFRKHKIEEKFIELITRYDFDLLDPDQAYLNYLCDGKILTLRNGWNKEPMPIPCEGDLNIVHYALYKKPWQYDDVPYGEYFWKYAEKSPFYHEILKRKNAFGDGERAEKAAMAAEILEHGLAIASSDYTFVTKLGGK